MSRSYAYQHDPSCALANSIAAVLKMASLVLGSNMFATYMIVTCLFEKWKFVCCLYDATLTPYDKALYLAITEFGKMSVGHMANYVEQLKKEKRYPPNVY